VVGVVGVVWCGWGGGGGGGGGGGWGGVVGGGGGGGGGGEVEVKWPVCDTDHSFPSGVEIKNEWSCIPVTVYALLALEGTTVPFLFGWGS
jgi:hypothetical protein